MLEHGKVRMEFVATSAESAGELHQMRVTYAPHSDLPPSHIHPARTRPSRSSTVRSSSILDGVPSGYAAGAVVEVPSGMVHQLHNISDQPATVGCWSTRPALRTGEFFMALHEANEAGDVDRLVAVIGEYDERVLPRGPSDVTAR